MMSPLGWRDDEPGSLIYLTGVSNSATRDSRLPNLGLLCQPGNSVHLDIDHYPAWAADNGCYSAGDRFDERAWIAWVAQLPRQQCLFVVAPDVVADAAATLTRSRPWLRVIRDLGFPAALVAQDGLEHLDVPWDGFDCLFIGGSTEWKLGAAAADLAHAARTRGKWVHMGRVNSWKRLAYASAHHCDSADGTYLRFGPTKNWPRLEAWLRRLAAPDDQRQLDLFSIA